MANGFMGSREQWDLMENPLLSVDSFLKEFVSIKNLELEKNYHSWPSRSVRWVSLSGLNCTIEIYLEDEKEMSFTANILASLDKEGYRYFYKKSLKKEITVPFNLEEIKELFKKGYKRANQIEFSQLKKATKLS